MNFNKIHIDSFVKIGCSLHLVGREHQFDNIDNYPQISKSIIPHFFYPEHSLGALINRIIYVLSLIWVRFKFSFSKFDLIIVPTYDPLSIFVLKSKVNTILITHDGHYLDNKIKRFCVRLTPRHYIHVGLSEEMTLHIKNMLGDRKVAFVPHGLCGMPSEFQRPTFLEGCNKYVFCPINRLFEQDFVERIFSDIKFETYLKENGLKLVVKKNLLRNVDSESVIVIENNLSKKEYDYLIKNSVAVILPYFKEYKYRCSGIMFECVVCDTPVLATRLDAWNYLQNRINLYMFETANELVDGLVFFGKNGIVPVDKSSFDPKPYWLSVIS